ncbi:lipocalin-like domain-containing protein [Marinobacterium aestuariivivens]|uniref:Lipocalin-like domain-containing protein n=1 Tax=Marinobacterium aestuariivivens TaxID=1698799 RepID=A0ABW2A2M6_9GAMM
MNSTIRTAIKRRGGCSSPVMGSLHRLRRLGGLLCILLLAGCGEPSGQQDGMESLSEPLQGFTLAAPGMAIELPRDLGPHRDFRLEWWYLTTNLQSRDGKRFGVQWTLFRVGLRPGPYHDRAPDWRRDEVWFAHAALSRPDDHRFASRSGRGGTGQAGAVANPFRAWIDHWQLDGSQRPWSLRVAADDFRYRLQLQPQKPPVFHGDRGFSAKSADGGGSMYFSYPLLEIDGELELDGERFEVAGRGWFDREWSSQYLQPDQQGWDWLALHLDDGRQLMLFRIRGSEPYYTGTLVASDGSARPLGADDFSLQPSRYRDSRFGPVPVDWRLELPTAGLSLDIRSWPGDYWNPGRLRYWEGPVRVSGSSDGEGYLEMTGYGD